MITNTSSESDFHCNIPSEAVNALFISDVAFVSHKKITAFLKTKLNISNITL